MNVFREEIRTGLLLVLSLLILFTVMLYLGAPGVFVPQKTFFIYVDNAGGIKEGADVALAGRKVGQVIKLWSPVPENKRPDPKKETMIEVKVAKTAQVYRQVKVMITSSSMLSEFYLDFTAGVEASGLAPDGATFLGEKELGLSDAVPMVLAKIDPVLKTATDTFESLQKTADNLTKLTSPAGDVPQMLQEFRNVGANLDKLSAAEGPLHKSLDNIALLTGEGGKLSKTLDHVEEVTSKTGPLQQALHNFQKLTADLANNQDLRFALRNSREATGQLNGTLTDLRGKLDDIAVNLDEATDTLKRQPWRLVWPSTKTYAERPHPLATPAPKIHKRRTHATSAI